MAWRGIFVWWGVVGLAVGVASWRGVSCAQEFEQEPISYSRTAPQNRVSELIEQIEAGWSPLEYEPTFGYLRSLLRHLSVPESSQTLVFSKTSLQRPRIAPHAPRALYFSDDIYVGYCQQGEVLEISAVDARLGAVFYTLRQVADERPQLVRQTDNCLICHASAMTRDVPGYMIRSVYTDASGEPVLSAGTHRIDHTSPLADRWGGWYVTGTHGDQSHLGNLVVRQDQVPKPNTPHDGMNLVSLGDRFDATAYLSSHSDLVALMVLEHQADAHNLIARANFLTRQAMHFQTSLNRELGEPVNQVWDSTRSRIRHANEPLVEYLLFSSEASLRRPIAGTTSFAAEFPQRGPRDSRGRSLRELDLERRLFKYPCSYLIYSPAFRGLPSESRDYVLGRIADILSGRERDAKFSHLTTTDRQAIADILRETLPDLPASWPKTVASSL